MKHTVVRYNNGLGANCIYYLADSVGSDAKKKLVFRNFQKSPARMFPQLKTKHERLFPLFIFVLFAAVRDALFTTLPYGSWQHCFVRF